MAKSNFGPVMAEIFKHEGGYVDHPRDPGGATNMGITHKTLADWRGHAVTKEDVRSLTKEEAGEIYRKRYWEPLYGDHLPYGHDLVAMDGGVNSGPRRGAKWLQKGVGAKADGRIGPKTIEACRSADVNSITRACDARMSFLQGLRHWDTFGRGWGRRVASVEAVGVRMWLAAGEGKRAAVKGLRERAEAAPRQAEDERRAGSAQAGAAGAGGTGGAAATDLPWEAIAVLALGAVIVAALLMFRAYRKAQFHEERHSAFRKEWEALL